MLQLLRLCCVPGTRGNCQQYSQHSDSAELQPAFTQARHRAADLAPFLCLLFQGPEAACKPPYCSRWFTQQPAHHMKSVILAGFFAGKNLLPDRAIYYKTAVTNLSWKIPGKSWVISSGPLYKFITAFLRQKNLLSELGNLSEEFSYWVLQVKHILLPRAVSKISALFLYA